jgi:hypothetical protein
LSLELQGIFGPPRDRLAGITADDTTPEAAAILDLPLAKCEPNECGFRLERLGDMLARPDVPPDYLVDGLLVRGTVSMIVAKPKVGKSTLARGLCLAVARGTNFLGRRTRQGSCIYLALEEREQELRADFRAMGADGSEPISVHADSAPEGGTLAFVELVRTHRPVLAVIDPLFRLARVRDEKAYSEVYTALGPLIDVSRETGTHILIAHHSGKKAKGDAIDSPLGSTALSGAVSTLILLTRTDNYRSVQTVQRIGTSMPETVLSFDADTRELSVGGTCAEADRDAIAQAMVDYLASSAEEKTESEICDAVEGSTRAKRNALRSLVGRGLVCREGSGKRGDPFKYLFSCSEPVARTGKQETPNYPQTRMDIERKLVPENAPGVDSEFLVRENMPGGSDTQEVRI